MILPRRKIVNTITAVKNRIRALLKGNGYTRAPHKGNWWKVVNRAWMRSFFEDAGITSGEMFNEKLVCRECGDSGLLKTNEIA